MSELYLPPERPQRNLVNGQLLKGCIPHNKGKKWSDYMPEEKCKMLSAKVKNNLSNIAGGRNAEPIVALDSEGNVVGWFESASDAQRKTGINSHSIRKVLRGIYKHAGGFRWELA